MTWRHLVTLLMAFSLIAAACGGSSSDAANGDSTDVATGEQESDSDDSDAESSDSTDESADDTSSESSPEEEYESPLGEFLGFTGFSTSEEDRAELEAEERERQETIASCMRAQGFEYTPIDPSQSFFFEESDEFEDWGSEEWTRKWGYGISTMAFSESQVSDGVLGNNYESQAEASGFDPESDPNYVYQQSLTEPEQEAYQKALYGEFPELPEDATDEEWAAAYDNFEPTGCEAQTYADDLAGEAFYTEFGDELDAMWEALESDPRIVAKEAEIERCVTDKGLIYLGDGEEYTYFEDKMQPIYEAVWEAEASAGPDFTDEELEQMTDEELDAVFGDFEPPKLTPEQNAELKAIQEEEIALAVTVLECGGGWEQLEATFNDVRIEYEQRFLDENAAALAAYKESAGN